MSLDDVSRAILMRLTKESLGAAWADVWPAAQHMVPAHVREEADDAVKTLIETMQSDDEAKALLALMGVLLGVTRHTRTMGEMLMELQGWGVEDLAKRIYEHEER